MTEHLRADEARAHLEESATPAPAEDLRPGIAAGHPTAFDAIGRTLVASRASAETLIAGAMALVQQIDAALAVLALITPAEYRDSIRRTLESAGSSTPPAPRDPRQGNAEPGKPRTFMQRD